MHHKLTKWSALMLMQCEPLFEFVRLAQTMHNKLRHSYACARTFCITASKFYVNVCLCLDVDVVHSHDSCTHICFTCCHHGIIFGIVDNFTCHRYEEVSILRVIDKF